MDLKAKRKQEVESQKEQRKEEVVAAAIEVFKRKGIENTKMTDVADEAHVGVASIYRYYKTKPDLVIAAATLLWKKEIDAIYQRFANGDFVKASGLDQVRSILEVFIHLYQYHPEFLRLLHEFDSYVVKESIELEKLSAYEASIINLKSHIGSAFRVGIADGSISSDIDFEIYYDTITHTLMSLCQKLLLRGEIISSDKVVSSETQIRMVIDMAVQYIQ